MNVNENIQFAEIMALCAANYRQEIDVNAVKLFWGMLKEYPLDEVRVAFEKHLRSSKFFPTISEIIDHLPDGRKGEHIGADEAWAIAKQAMNTNNSVCATEEILQAMDVAQQVYNSRDENPARMAFRDAYNRIVKMSSTKPRWFMSVGDDISQIESVALKAIQLGRLPVGSDEKYRIEPPSITFAGLIEGYKAKVDPSVEIKKIKLALYEEIKPREKVSLSDEDYENLPWYLKETKKTS